MQSSIPRRTSLRARFCKGRVVRIAGDDIVVDIGYKSEGFIPKSEFEYGLEDIEPGVELEVYLDQIEDASGLVVLSKKKADRIRGWERVMQAYKVGDVVKGKAVRKIKGGLLIDIGVHVFLPASQIDVRRVGDPGDWIGRDLECKIIKIDEERRNIVLSRRKMLEEERDKMKKDLLGSIQRGEVRRGVVKNITEFGAFIDLGGIDGLLHITDMSWGRIQHPSEMLKVDQMIEVKVLDFDPVRERISLGLKQLSQNPWQAAPTKYPIGSKVKGEIVNIMPYGAFVKLEPGVEGLVHISEMSWTRSIQHPNDIVQLGQQVEVVVLDINPEKQEISLGMKQAEANPWTNVEERYPAGTKIKGKVRNMTTYGAFVELEEGIDGLLHVSDMSWTKKVTHPSALLKKGDEVEAVVLSVDKERKRVALGLKQLADRSVGDRHPQPLQGRRQGQRRSDEAHQLRRVRRDRQGPRRPAAHLRNVRQQSREARRCRQAEPEAGTARVERRSERTQDRPEPAHQPGHWRGADGSRSGRSESQGSSGCGGSQGKGSQEGLS